MPTHMDKTTNQAHQHDCLFTFSVPAATCTLQFIYLSLRRFPHFPREDESVGTAHMQFLEKSHTTVSTV